MTFDMFVCGFYVTHMFTYYYNQGFKNIIFNHLNCKPSYRDHALLRFSIEHYYALYIIIIKADKLQVRTLGFGVNSFKSGHFHLCKVSQCH